jgi:predicted Zn finger-like uncharacterized protein
MYTHCPHCGTYFRVTSEQLKTANGDVRCGRCFGTFNALLHLVDEPPIKTSKPAPPTLADSLEQGMDQEATFAQEAAPAEPEQNQHKTIEQFEITSANEPAPQPENKDIKRDHSQQLIKELQTHKKSSGSTGKRLAWGMLSILLALVLVTQYAYFSLDKLSQTAQYRPALETLCSFANCEVPLMKAPHLVKLTERDIRAHAKTKDVLVVKAVIHNEADFTQAFPLMQLSMQDITGHTMTGRRFLPKEYLADPAINIRAGIAANKSYEILLEMIDPGKEAVGFEFDFL